MSERIQRVREMDRTTLAGIAAFAALVVAALFPQVWPAAQRGVECYDLAAPLGGNNRSLLAQSGNDQQNLELKLSLEQDSIGYSERLKVHATFSNTDIGPVILYLDDGDRAVISNDWDFVGLRFEIIPVGGASPSENRTTGVQRISSWVLPSDLHLIGARSRCTIEYSISLTEVLGASLAPGDYRIRAFYYNNNAGSTLPGVLGDPTPTATPAYFDQGVWIGRLQSEEKRFTVRSP
jgi:hypothetical protein